jgi:hypothetical protein
MIPAANVKTEIVRKSCTPCDTCQEREQGNNMRERSYDTLTAVGRLIHQPGPLETTHQYYQCSQCGELWTEERDNRPGWRNHILFKTLKWISPSSLPGPYSQ